MKHLWVAKTAWMSNLGQMCPDQEYLKNEVASVSDIKTMLKLSLVENQYCNLG